MSLALNILWLISIGKILILLWVWVGEDWLVQVTLIILSGRSSVNSNREKMIMVREVNCQLIPFLRVRKLVFLVGSSTNLTPCQFQ